MDTSTINMLECFQCEIGRRILRLPKQHSKKAVRLALQWPSVSTKILIRKLTFLAKLLSNTEDTVSNRIFSSLAIMDVYNVGIVQQCQMLESELNTYTLAMCLRQPLEATSTVASKKSAILEADFDTLLSCVSNHHPAKFVASVAQTTSWCKLWDIALDRGVQGTRGLQTLLLERSRRTFANYICRVCGDTLNKDSVWFEHVCQNHPNVVNHLSCEEIISALKATNSSVIFSIANSN